MHTNSKSQRITDLSAIIEGLVRAGIELFSCSLLTVHFFFYPVFFAIHQFERCQYT